MKRMKAHFVLVVVVLACVVLVAADDFEDSMRRFVEKKKAGCSPCPDGSKHVFTVDFELECMATQEEVQAIKTTVVSNSDRLTVAEGKIKRNSDAITSLSKVVGNLAANQTVINSELRNWGFSFLAKPVQLVEPNVVHSLAGVVPLGTTEVVVQVVVKAQFKGATASCGVRVHVNGLQSQYVDAYEAFRNPVTTWLRETAFLTLPVDVSDPIVTWSWEITNTGCYNVDTTEVNVLGAFRGGRSLSLSS